ncbi:hypothetical protein [Rhizobium sp. Pop5]|uniref:hypothetical protein n=1 Tax=Rhizobium sp. Pop5 TaxID=1223565 RepID=UPI0002838FEF|nr:hypothetical protein [Rhizobium sp. Pop5]EJZ17389.1 hypothetical protein RCCGEPOP_31009 [Rhizobium sp. Pop5]
MVTVIANERGYFDGELREIGACFVVPDELWNDEERRPKWASLAPRGVGGARIVKPKGGAGDDVVAEIPEDWQSLSATARKALARSISGELVANMKDADGVIAAEIERRAAEAGSDGEKVAGNGIQEALGLQQPDWVVPGAS